MNQFLKRAAQRVAPRTVANIKTLTTLDQEFDQGAARFINYEREIWALRREIDELRRDNRRVSELYDAVFDWVRANGGTPPAPARAAAPTVERVAEELVDGDE